MKNKLVDYGSDSDDDTAAPVQPTPITTAAKPQPQTSKPEVKTNKVEQVKPKKINFESLLNNNLSSRSLKDKISSLREEINDWMPTKQEFSKPSDEGDHPVNGSSQANKNKSMGLSEKFLKSLPKPKNSFGGADSRALFEEPLVHKQLVKEAQSTQESQSQSRAVFQTSLSHGDAELIEQHDTQYNAPRGGARHNITEVNVDQLADFDYNAYVTKLKNAKDRDSVNAPSKTQKAKNQLNAVAYQFINEEMIGDPTTTLKDTLKQTKGKYGW